MGNNQDRDELNYNRLTEALEPVLKSAQQLLLVMVEVRVSQTEVANLKATVARLETLIEKNNATLHGRCDKLDVDVRGKADKTDLNTLAGQTQNNAVSVGKLVGGVAVVAIVTSIIVGLVIKLAEK